MKKLWTAIAVAVTLSLGASAQSSGNAQASGSVNTDTSVSGNRQGAQVDSNTSVDAGANASHDRRHGAQGNAGASTAASAQGNGISSASLASGATIAATLTKPVDVKKAKQGDEVVARATQNVVSQGNVVVPRGSKLIGHVTEAKARGNGEAESTLGIAFDKAVLKNGQEIPLQASIRAISAAAAKEDDDAMSGGLQSAGAANAGGGGNARGGVLGGATGTIGTAPGPIGSTAGGVANSTVNSAGQVAAPVTGNGGGMITSSSQGVIGLRGLALNSQAGANGSVVTSATKNVRLESGTQLLLQVSK